MKAFQKHITCPISKFNSQWPKTLFTIQRFLDSDQNPFSVAICQATEIFVTNSLATNTLFWSPTTIFFVLHYWVFNYLWLPHIELDESFPKTHYMPPFQIHSWTIENFHLPSNVQVFSNGNQNPFLVTNNLATESFFWLLATFVLCPWWLNFLLQHIKLD